jgi:N,N'-diacetyllegionaminate synthase
LKPITDYLKPDNTNCLIIAEVAQTHDGSLGQAHAFIDAVAETGANAIKFQTHIAEAESTPSEPFRVHFSKQDANRYDYWERMEFSEQQWLGLAEHASAKGLYFLSSPFSLEAVELLERINVPAWKIGSGESNNYPMLERIAATRKPIFLSSGMSTWEEIEKSVDFLRSRQVPLALFQATTMYPTPPEKIGLNAIAEYRQKFNCPVGLSDHSGTIFPSLAAYTLGVRLIEVHVTLSRYMFGPDVSSSVTVEELSQLVEGIRFLETALAHPVTKDDMAQELESLRKTFQKSVVAKVNLKSGTILNPEYLTLKKPGIGIAAELLPKLYGKTLKRDVSKDEFFTLKDVEGVE